MELFEEYTSEGEKELRNEIKPEENKEQPEILKRKLEKELEENQKTLKTREKELEEARKKKEQKINEAADLEEDQEYKSIENIIITFSFQIEDLKKEEANIRKQIEELER